MSKKIQHEYSVVLKGNNIVIKKGDLVMYLPPARRANIRITPRTDFCLFGKAIGNNLGFSELYGEVKRIKEEQE